ncbi:MAG: TIGR02757 family protein [Kiritimatiellae bacterium]|nr:TIGR02757 family protein [Kiritimatiellia bacterium]
MDPSLKKLLRHYAAKYETADFLTGDPSYFMHQAAGAENQEATAFVASCLSFGGRKQFLPKIQYLVDRAGGDVDLWIRNGGFEKEFPETGNLCFYRFFNHAHMYRFFGAYRKLLDEYGTLGEYVKARSDRDGRKAVCAICNYFSEAGVDAVVPKNTQSACKRICMFLRWMVRAGSPVDLGIWGDFIDRATLVMPLDTHVMQQSVRLGLVKSANASMNAAIRLTAKLAEVFPGDPLKGDFALFGYGVNR